MSVMSSLAVVGLGAVGVFTTLVVQQVGWMLARSKRWDDQRRSCYAAFAAAAKRETRLCLRILASFHPGGPRVPAISAVEGRPMLEQVADERSGLFEDLLLLGNQAVVTAARGWQEKPGSWRRLLITRLPRQRQHSTSWSTRPAWPEMSSSPRHAGTWEWQATLG